MNSRPSGKSAPKRRHFHAPRGRAHAILFPPPPSWLSPLREPEGAARRYKQRARIRRRRARGGQFFPRSFVLPRSRHAKQLRA